MHRGSVEAGVGGEEGLLVHHLGSQALVSRVDPSEETRVKVQPSVGRRMHLRGLGPESSRDTRRKIRAEGDAEAAGNVGMGEETVASRGVVGVGGRVEVGRNRVTMREVKEAEDRLGDGLDGKTSLCSKIKSGLDLGDALRVGGEDKAPNIIRIRSSGGGEDRKGRDRMRIGRRGGVFVGA